MEARGIAFVGEPNPSEMARLARRAEALGYESVWATETRFTRDALVPCAAMAQATSEILVGSAVVNCYTRGPVLLGISFATLDELSGGRLVAGIGPGSPRVLQAQGLEFTDALGRLREYVVVIRNLLRGKEVEYQGRHVSVSGVRLDFTPLRSEIPIVFGATGPRALELAGEIADGVLFNSFMPENYYREEAKERLSKGLEGRDGAEFAVRGLVPCSIDKEGKRAKDRLRPMLATYLTRFPNLARQTGYPQEELALLSAKVAGEGVAEAGKLIPEEWIDALAVAGEPDECIERMERYIDWGLDVPVVAPMANVELALETLKP